MKKFQSELSAEELNQLKGGNSELGLHCCDDDDDDDRKCCCTCVRCTQSCQIASST